MYAYRSGQPTTTAGTPLHSRVADTTEKKSVRPRTEPAPETVELKV